MKKLLLLFFIFNSFCAFSQKDSIKVSRKDSIKVKRKKTVINDSIKLENNNVLIGEIKSLINGIITMKTPYSDKDFKIEYKEVTEIYLDQTFLINLVNGSHYLGKVKTVSKGKVEVISDDMTFETKIENIVQLKASGNNFFSRFTGEIDLAFNLTKANNFSQFTLSGKLRYVGELWSFSTAYSSLLSKQDNVEDIKRVEWSLDGTRFLIREFFGIAQVSFLSNTEQALDGRTTTLLGIGKDMLRSHRLYLRTSIGVNYNVETYYDDSLNKNSTEANISTEFNMYEFGDFRLITDLTLYPSLSESGRFRTDYSIDLKYDLPWDFYIKFDFTLNYDNQPAIEGNDFDYIFNSGFGWELK